MVKKVNLSHNLSPEELEETLEKALSSLRKRVKDSNAALTSKQAEKLRKESFLLFDDVFENMLSEISDVVKGA